MRDGARGRGATSLRQPLGLETGSARAAAPPRAPLRLRLARSRAVLARVRGALFDALPGGGGWSAVLRIGETVDEEGPCAAPLEDGVAVQPGSFHDLERSGHLVVSLLAEPEPFREGLARADAALRRMLHPA